MLGRVDGPVEHCLGCASAHVALLEFLGGIWVEAVFIIVVIQAEEDINCAEQIPCHLFLLLLAALYHYDNFIEVNFSVGDI